MSKYRPTIDVPKGARVLCLKKAQVESILAGGSFAGHTSKPLPELVGEAFLLETGAKAYYVGGGCWMFSGYAHDGSDVEGAIASIRY